MSPNRLKIGKRFRQFSLQIVCFAGLACALNVFSLAVNAQETGNAAPAIGKVEPPGWWLGLTSEVMVLLSGRNLQATQVSCNMPTLRIARTQATGGGAYLFVWLKFGPDMRTGTAVCRVSTPTGDASFELPLAARPPAAGKFQGLSQDDVIYLIMPDRFADGDPTNDRQSGASGDVDRSKPRAYHGGDLRGIREHLPYLKDLGVSVLWLTPVLKNGTAQDYHGYGATDLYAVEPHLGTLQEYQSLVSAAHSQGMKILFDAVPNHVGPHHPWVTNPPTPDWFHGSVQRHTNSAAPRAAEFYGEPANPKIAHDPFEILADPHAPAELSKNLTDGWFANVLPDLNTENPLVAQYLLQNSIWWAETSGLDGFRLDTFPYVPRKFWAGWHSGLRRIYPRLTTIGEVFHPDPAVTSFFAGGHKRYDGVDSGVSTLFDFPLFFTLREVLWGGAPASRLAGVLRRDSLYQRPDSLVTFFSNHDVTRPANLPGATASRLQLAFGLLLTIRGIPEIYYGDEIALPGGGDPDNRRDFPGGWTGDAQNAFHSEGRTTEQQMLFSYVQKLLQLRREHPALASGHIWHLASDETAYVFLRESDEERLVVAFNNSERARELHVPLNETPAQGASGLAKLVGAGDATVSGAEININMPAQSLSIFLLN